MKLEFKTWKFTTFWNFHDMCKSSLWTYISPVNQTLISTPVKEQTVFLCPDTTYFLGFKSRHICTPSAQMQAHHQIVWQALQWTMLMHIQKSQILFSTQWIAEWLRLERISRGHLIHPFSVQAGSYTTGNPGSLSGSFWISPWMEIPQPIWVACSSAHSPWKVFILRNEYSNEFSFF